MLGLLPTDITEISADKINLLGHDILKFKEKDYKKVIRLLLLVVFMEKSLRYKKQQLLLKLKVKID
jgi:DNA topoisomerase VI subunit A